MSVKFTDEALQHMAVCTSQYDSTCRALAAELIQTRLDLKALHEQYIDEIRDAAREARGAAEEAYWQGRQGDDHGSF